MKDVEQYIKPFNRFEMANGGRGVFLDVDGRVIGVYFEWEDMACWQHSPLQHIEEAFAPYRVVKIWAGIGANITQDFDYSVTPIWQEESEEQRDRRKQIEQLEETIKKAQQQIEQLKETH